MQDIILKMLKEIKPDIDWRGGNGFIDEGIIDSFDIASLIGSFEDSFGIEIDPEDILPENFNTMEAMELLIQKYLK